MGGNFVFYIEVPGGACFEQGNPRIREPQAVACNIIFYHSERITFLKALPGVRCMVCWQGATHGHPTHVHPMVAMVAHRAWRYFV